MMSALMLRSLLGATLVTLVAACQSADPPTDYETITVAPEEIERNGASPDFVGIRSTVTTGDGTWVLDRAAPFVTHVASDAESTVTRFGSLGDGPGELRHPVAIQATPEGLDVWDVAKAEVVTYDPSGVLIAIRPLSNERGGWIRPDMAEVSYLDPWRVRRLDGHVVFARFPNGLTQLPDAASGALVRGGTDLDPSQTILEYRDLVPRDGRALGQFATMPLWDACGNAVVVWNPARSELEWFDPHGQRTDAATVDARPPPLTDDGIVRFLRLMARLEIGPDFEAADIDFQSMARKVRPEFDALAPAIVDVRCGGANTAWLQLFDPEGDPLGHGRRWLRVRPGSAPSVVAFPPDFRPTEFGDDAMVGFEDAPSGQTLSLWRTQRHSTT